MNWESQRLALDPHLPVFFNGERERGRRDSIYLQSRKTRRATVKRNAIPVRVGENSIEVASEKEGGRRAQSCPSGRRRDEY